MTRARLRPFRALLVTGLIAAGAVALPATSAEAGAQNFSLAVTGGYNNGQNLGTASGTITAEAGATSATYSLTVCGQSTYPNSRVTITAGSGSVTQYAQAGQCASFSGTITSSYGFTKATITLYGSTFYPGNTYQTYSRDQSVSFGTIVTPPPTQVTAPFSLNVTGGSNNSQNLGSANGSITSTRGTTTATYSVTLCGQSTYPSASVRITAGSATVTHTVYYQNCQTFSGTLSSSYGITSASIVASGSTFYPGNTYTTYTKTRTISF